jgi:hypothetical protein
MKASDLLENIEYSSGNRSFAYNKYFDREDFLYADDDTVFTGILNVVGGIHQVQTFKNEQAGSGEELVNLRAKKNICVFVLRVREKDRYGEHAQWEKQFGFFWGNFKDYSIESYDVKAGEVLSVKGTGKGDASPLIFVREIFVKK